MSSTHQLSPPPAPAGGWSRRGTLGLLLAAPVAALAGCASLTDPVVRGTNSLEPPPVPSPEPEFVAAADEVEGLRALVSGLGAAAPAAWVEAVSAMLAAHVAVLTSRDPLGGLATPQPWFSPSASAPPAAPGIGLEQWTSAAADLAGAHSARATGAASPDLAMLWASLAAATTLHASPGPVPVAGPLPGPVEVDEEAACRNVLLAHLHALAQLLEVGVGITDGEVRTAYQNRLAQVRGLVVEQQALIRALGADPVGPLPGYDLPGATSTADQVAATWTLVEQQVFAAHAPVAAASPSAGRAAAITAMEAQGRAVQGRGGSISFFPGWV
ncbi:DUF4439 domain-containing protein [Propionibacteriaceae bacterium Y1923]|uniref:DUF4439 domain-containing protein n=1 Tax=Aestuariimicrobium sp. Y1814 TaxID=3418742 RepID=UPI003C16924F